MKKFGILAVALMFAGGCGGGYESACENAQDLCKDTTEELTDVEKGVADAMVTVDCAAMAELNDAAYEAADDAQKEATDKAIDCANDAGTCKAVVACYTAE